MFWASLCTWAFRPFGVVLIVLSGLLGLLGVGLWPLRVFFSWHWILDGHLLPCSLLLLVFVFTSKNNKISFFVVRKKKKENYIQVLGKKKQNS